MTTLHVPAHTSGFVIFVSRPRTQHTKQDLYWSMWRGAYPHTRDMLAASRDSPHAPPATYIICVRIRQPRLTTQTGHRPMSMAHKTYADASAGMLAHLPKDKSVKVGV